MLGGARTGENFIRLSFTRCRRTRQSAADAFSEKDLYGYRQGAISVTTGPQPLDARTGLDRFDYSDTQVVGIRRSDTRPMVERRGNGWQLMFDDANL